ncbi:MAG: bifunctional adenosylcobinamide kinase/adenosylcobinamide-phosphate guanylyltransferase [Blautia sp.]|nr:bifunctional adenosylcobinamide kinase/adenosylcobinamide-phosphate guanylyltransferase [Lachnoclostridium sp.]MCM1210772.1 bifunctional adenosylcobinamide kinase/adenosylcobinamide-phosphate guanylyltransferase [Blautia sp.]
MKLVIGGYAQGKLDYVLSKYSLPKDAVWDSVLPDDAVLKGSQKEQYGQYGQKPLVVINHFHLWVKNRMINGGQPEEEIMAFLNKCDNCVIISDEIGNGIVPLVQFEREYRECVGRILIRLAGKAEEVERVLCGINQKIK